MPDRRLHVVVVGGGITGLSAAWQLIRQAPDIRVTLLEGAPVLGGKLRVSQVAGIDIDEGAEAMLNRRPEAVELCRAVGLGDDLVHPDTTSAAVWTRGDVRPLPPTVMGVPADLAALRRSGIVSPRGLRRAAVDRIRSGRLVTGDVAIGHLVARRLGAEIRDRLVEPLLGGVYAGHADQLSLRATAPRLAAEVGKRRSLLDAAERAIAAGPADGVPVFAGLHGGVGRLARRLSRVLEGAGVELRCGAMVRELRPRADGWRLVIGPTRDEEVLNADAVLLAVPAPVGARLLEPVVADAAQELRQIDYASVAVVTLAFQRAAVGDRLRGSGFLVPPIDRRLVKAATYSSNKWGWLSTAAPDFAFVRLSVGRLREEHDLQYDDAELTNRALADLQNATGLTARPVDTRVTRWGGALPQYAVGHLDRVARIRAAIDRHPGLAVCGAAYDGIGIAACIASAERATTRLLADRSRQGTISR